LTFAEALGGRDRREVDPSAAGLGVPLLRLVISGQIGPQETVLDYYARFLHNISLLFHMTQGRSD